MFSSIGLLICSNVFMIFAWYSHLKGEQLKPLWIVILMSWGIAFFEYCLQVPGNRIGIKYFNLGQLKVLQEVITMVVFSAFSIFYMKVPITANYIYASLCLVLAAYFIFRN